MMLRGSLSWRPLAVAPAFGLGALTGNSIFPATASPWCTTIPAASAGLGGTQYRGFTTTPPLRGSPASARKKMQPSAKLPTKGANKWKNINKKNSGGGKNKATRRSKHQSNSSTSATSAGTIVLEAAAPHLTTTPKDTHEAMSFLAMTIHKEQQEQRDGTGTAPDFTQTLLAEFRNKFKGQFPQHFRLRLAVAEELAGANIVIPTGFKDGQRVILPAIAMRAECHDRRFSETKSISQNNERRNSGRGGKGRNGGKHISEVSTLSWVYMPADPSKPMLRRVYSGKTMDKVRKTAVSDFQRAVPDVTLLS